jgi:hypothetical protein
MTDLSITDPSAAPSAVGAAVPSGVDGQPAPPLPSPPEAQADQGTAAPGAARRPRRHADPETGEFDAALLDLAGKPLSPDAQKVYGELVSLYDDLAAASNPTLYRQAHLATELLSGQTPNLDAARVVVGSLRTLTSHGTPVYAVMRGVVAFVAAGALIMLAVTAILVSGTHAGAFLQHHAEFLVAGFFGALGSVVSILLRAKGYEAASLRSRPLLKLTGFCLPGVGTAFAFVVAALFTSGIVNLGFQPRDPSLPVNYSFFVVIGFLSGFSERFAQRLLGTVEGQFEGNAGAPAARGTPSAGGGKAA